MTLNAAPQPGALFLFAETTHRLWPEILQCALDELEGPVPISLPTNLPGRSGSTMMLQKGAAGAPDARALPPDHPYALLLRRFVEDNAAHERRLERDRDRGARTSGRSPWRGGGNVVDHWSATRGIRAPL